MSGPVTQQRDILCQFLKRLFYISNVCDIWVLVVPNIEKVIPAAVVVFTCTKAVLVVEFSHMVIYHKK